MVLSTENIARRDFSPSSRLWSWAATSARESGAPRSIS
jgi:hypothetical protein